MMPNAQGPQALVGQVFAGYRLEQLASVQEADAVFFARRADNPADVASVQVLLPPWPMDEAARADFQARFRRTMEAVQRLSSPSVVHVRAFGDEQGMSYIVLPFLPGGTLAQRLARPPMPMSVAEVAAHVTRIAAALDEARAQGITHGGLTPASIYLDAQGNALAGDFGLTALFEETRARMMLNQPLLGTFTYQPPERLAGAPPSPQADLYSLGVIAYQMLTGQVPLYSASPAEVQRLRVQYAPPPVRQLRPDLPPAAEAAILSALSPSPTQRPAIAGLVAQALTAGLATSYPPRPAMPAAPPQPYPPAQPYPQPYPPQPSPQQPAPASPPPTPPMPPIVSTGAGGTGGGSNHGGMWAGALAVVLIVSLLGTFFVVSRPAGNAGPTAQVTPSPTLGVTPSPTDVPAPADTNIKIATSFAVSGADAAAQLSAEYGVDLAVSQNQDLGNGYTLSVVHTDYEGQEGIDANIGQQQITQLQNDPEVMAVVGPFNSSVAKQEIPVVNAGGGPVLISPTNTNVGLTMQQYAAEAGVSFETLHPAGQPDYYFRLSANDYWQAKADATIALTAPQIMAKSVYVVDDNTTYGKPLADIFTSFFTTGGGQIVGTRATITSDTLSTIPQIVAQIKAAKPDAVFYGGVTSQGGCKLKKALVSAGYTKPMIVGDGVAADPACNADAGQAAVGLIGTVAGPDPSALTSAATSFESAYTQFTAGKPANEFTPYAMQSYDAAMIEITAIKSLIQAGQAVTRSAVRDAVANISYQGLTGTISFDGNGDTTNRIFSVYAVTSASPSQWTYQQQMIVS